MCGFELYLEHDGQLAVQSMRVTIGRARGPDGERTERVSVPLGSSSSSSSSTTSSTSSSSRQLALKACVLGLRGRTIAYQPLVKSISSSPTISSSSYSSLASSTDCLLAWNGEVFGGAVQVGRWENDGEQVLEALYRACEKTQQPNDEPEPEEQEDDNMTASVLQVVDGVEGPFAFCFFHPPSRRLWFARDRLGRRSLLYRAVPFALSSVLPAEALSAAESLAADAHPDVSSPPAASPFCPPGTLSTLPRHCQRLSDFADWRELPVEAVFCLDLALPGEQLRVYPRASLSAGGYLPCSTAPVSASDLEQHLLQRHAAGIPSFLPYGPRTRLSVAEYGRESAQVVAQAHQLLREAVRLRVEGVGHLSVLFSGGLDSMLLAAIACDFLLPCGARIDLINVAFGSDAASPADFQSVPDRITGVEGFAALRLRTAAKDVAEDGTGEERLRFVAVDVRRSLLEAAVGSFLPFLIYPQTTVMDATICAALWFAAQRSAPASRVIMLGHGADELCAGYSRHVQAFERRGGVSGLDEELERDIARLWTRNLGRDDRVIASLGKEARHPFLDESFVRFIHSVPAELLCDLSLPKGTGDKQVLRAIARDHLDIPQAATIPKRAIQFGSRIAKFLPKKGKSQLEHAR